MPARIEYKRGDRVGNLLFVKEKPPRSFRCGRSMRQAEFKCECGTIFTTLISSVRSGTTRSWMPKKSNDLREAHKTRPQQTRTHN